MGDAFGRFAQRSRDDLLDFRRRIVWFTTSARTHLPDTGDPLSGHAFAPKRSGMAVDFKLRGHLQILVALGE